MDECKHYIIMKLKMQLIKQTDTKTDNDKKKIKHRIRLG